MIDDRQIAHARMQMERMLRDINREVINDLIPELNEEQVEPLFRLVATARGKYLKRLLDLAHHSTDLPTEQQVKELNLLRRSYEELLSGGQMLETAIERGYLDVKDPLEK